MTSLLIRRLANPDPQAALTVTRCGGPGSRAVDSAFTWLIPRGKVPALGDRRQGVPGVDIKAGL